MAHRERHPDVVPDAPTATKGVWMLLPLLLALSMPLQTPQAAPAPDALPPPGLNAPTTAAVQLLAGGAACCAVGTLVTSVPLLGPLVAAVVAGPLIGGVETVVGDAIGNSRSALLWPVITSTGIFVAGGITTAVASYVAATSFSADPRLYSMIFATPFVTSALGLVVPVVVYHLAATPKAHGDPGGIGVPGIIKPSDPTNSRDPPATTPAVPANAPRPAPDLIY